MPPVFPPASVYNLAIATSHNKTCRGDLFAVVLVGFMGAGKTSAGQELARLLHWPFVDLDDVIRTQSGREIAEIFQRSGESEFRRLESQALKAVLSSSNAQTVLAIGGGAFVQPENQELLRSIPARIVFLDASPEILMARCRQHGVQRPLFQDENQFRQLYESRRSSYMKADLCLDTSQLSISQVAAEVVKALELILQIPVSKDSSDEV
ncbi:MAG TPA: shikimate kinase [Terriglobales bacterium]|nr:shikimate kinase [Terriglobales bacterium]